MRIDAHHHLWDLNAVSYPWLMADEVRFFGDPTPIRRDYLMPEFRADASAHGITGSVHIQVGAEDAWVEAAWIDQVAAETPGWPAAQVVFCDLTAPDREAQLDRYQTLRSVRGVRQIVGRAPGEDAVTGTNALLDNPNFAEGLASAGARGLSFDLQLIPALMSRAAKVLATVPQTQVALCHAGSPHDRSAAGLADWRARLADLAALPQVTCKLSGLGMFDHNWTIEGIRPIVDTCLDLFGPGRCMFGSNFPVDSLSSDYATLFTAYETLVPEPMQPRVFGGTAAAFYRLD